MKDFISSTGYSRLELKTDGEPALLAVQDAVSRYTAHDALFENPLSHNPQASEEAERVVAEVKAQFCAVKIGWESRMRNNR